MAARFFSHAADSELLDRLVLAASEPDDPTRQHPWRVGGLAGRLATELGYREADALIVGGAARYHDIGKIGIPATVLARRGPLSELERRLVRTHTTIGEQILSGGRSPLLRMAAQIALTHHERWDGEGYPRRLHRSAIPVAARIVAVADAWDALTHDRPYRSARTENEALTELGRHAGTQFDPAIVDALGRMLATGDLPNGPAAMRRQVS